jgi:outer membrane protein TolC
MTLLAGNQYGPGWMQGKPKAKTNPAAAPEPKAPIAPQVPARKSASKVLPIPVKPPRSVPAEETLVREIPGNGLLGEDALIRLAIANSPDLARLRAAVQISQAKALGVKDWENPELRIGYAWDHDERIREAFTERATEQISTSEQFSTTQSQRNLAGEFFPGFGDSQLQSTSGSLNTSRYRTIERRVTPGRFRDVIDTTVYENRNSASSGQQRTADTVFGATGLKNEAENATTDRRIVERSRQMVNHPDDFGRGDQLSILIRLKPPNYWERCAKIEMAAAATARAESEYLIEEDKIVRTVRALYEDLNMGESVARASLARRAVQEKLGTEIETANVPELADLAADVRLEVSKSIRDQREFRSDISRQRQELAAFCGLGQPERIGTQEHPTHRTVPADDLDVDYLTTMAMLHRSDLLDLQARLAIAKAELMRTKAAKIPFFTFIDAGWATSQTEGRTGESDEWSVRAGISLPIFDWTGLNKAHLEHEKATELYTKRIDDQRRLIAIEIRAALTRIRMATKELNAFDGDFERIRANAAKSIAQTAVDPIKSLKTKYQNEDLIAKFAQDRNEVWSDYSKAVMALERALGTRLEQVLNR